MVLTNALPDDIVPSDDIPIGAIFDFSNSHVSQTDAAASQGDSAIVKTVKELKASDLSNDLQAKVRQHFENLLGSTPVKPQGRPDPDTLVAFNAHAQLVKDWLPEEKVFAAHLKKKTI